MIRKSPKAMGIGMVLLLSVALQATVPLSTDLLPDAHIWQNAPIDSDLADAVAYFEQEKTDTHALIISGNEVVWLRLPPLSQLYDQWLQVGRIDYATVFVPNQGKWAEGGTLCSPRHRSLSLYGRDQWLPLPDIASEQSVFIRLQNVRGYERPLVARLVPAAAARNTSIPLSLGFYIGFMACIVVFYLCIFFTIWRQPFMWQALFVGGFLILFMDLTGVLHNFALFGKSPLLKATFVYGAATVASIGFALFLRDYTLLSDGSLFWRKSFRVLIFARVALWLGLITVHAITLQEAWLDKVLAASFVMEWLLFYMPYFWRFSNTHRQRTDSVLLLTIILVYLALSLHTGLAVLFEFLPIEVLMFTGILMEALLFIYLFGRSWVQMRRRERQLKAEQLAIKTKRELFENLSHDIRTPITVFQGAINQLDIVQTNENAPYLELLKSSANRILHFFDQALWLSKNQAATRPLQKEQTDVVTLISENIHTMLSIAIQQEVELLWSSNCSHYHARIDSKALLRIIENLLRNSLTYTEPYGQVELVLTITERNAQQADMLLSFIDTGTGIQASQQRHIFDRYTRAGQTSIDGKGIGLHLSQQIARQMGGVITVVSEPDKGSLFELSLPLQKAMVYEEVAVDSSTVGTGRSNLLVAEDDPHMQQYLQLFLSKTYTVAMAENGKIALQMARQHPPDLLILDWMMPEMDGRDTLKAIRKDATLSHLPIVMLTAKAGIDNRLQGLGIGADAYLTKPFNEQELLLTIQRLLVSRREVQSVHMPEGNSISNSAKQDVVFQSRIEAVIEDKHGDAEFGVEKLAMHLSMSRAQLYRKTKAEYNQSPSILLRHYRLAKAYEFLQLNHFSSVKEVAYVSGFRDASYFTKLFQNRYQINPQDLLTKDFLDSTNAQTPNK